MEFRDFYELSAKVAEYEELLCKENQRRKTTMGTYFQKICYQKITIVDLST